MREFSLTRAGARENLIRYAGNSMSECLVLIVLSVWFDSTEEAALRGGESTSWTGIRRRNSRVNQHGFPSPLTTKTPLRL